MATIQSKNKRLGFDPTLVVGLSESEFVDQYKKFVNPTELSKLYNKHVKPLQKPKKPKKVDGSSKDSGETK